MKKVLFLIASILGIVASIAMICLEGNVLLNANEIFKNQLLPGQEILDSSIGFGIVVMMVLFGLVLVLNICMLFVYKKYVEGKRGIIIATIVFNIICATIGIVAGSTGTMLWTVFAFLYIVAVILFIIDLINKSKRTNNN